MTYEIGQKVETPLGIGLVGAIGEDLKGNTLVAVNVGKLPIDYIGISFKESDIKPYKTPHEKLLGMGFEMVLDDEHFMIFEHQKLDYTICVDKLWKGIGIHHYNDDPHYRYIYLELSRIITEYLEWLEEMK